MATVKRYVIAVYARKMGVSKQYVGREVKKGNLETVWSEEMDKILILDTIKNTEFFSNPHPNRAKSRKLTLKS